MSKKVYSRPELSAYGEFANLTQQTGSGFADFQASITNNSISATVTPGADFLTSGGTVNGQSFTVAS
ncbi:MAG: hypothetical protein AAFS12_06060 [Cyanobacteria bacterium J06632_19]